MSITLVAEPLTTTRTRPVRLGVVSFINTLPLINGLENLRDVELQHSVPSGLLDELLSGRVDLALCSSIDYQRSPQPLLVIPAGLLGCDGPTLTVRLFSAVPIKRITRVYCDTDSHTSIALMRILLKELYDVDPQLVDYDARENVSDNRPLPWPEAMLLIGDKVVTNPAPAIRYPFQLDLGAMWQELTSLPFVFALWMARRETDPALIRAAAIVLDHQRRHNVQRIDRIIHRHAKPRHWPPDLAGDYLKQKLNYEMTDRHLQGLNLFFEKAHAHKLFDLRREITYFSY